MYKNVPIYCVSTFADNKTPIVNALVSKVFVRGNLCCIDPVEIPYYSSGIFDLNVCYYCGSAAPESRAENYPVCASCSTSKELPQKRRKLFDKNRKK